MIHNIVQQAMRNSAALKLCTKAGCYKCLKLFDPQEVKEFTDQGQTALCPYCGTDAVIAESSSQGALDADFLQKVHNFLFND